MSASPRTSPAWAVRVLRPDGKEVAGSGVLIAGDQILTCAHVVNAALRPRSAQARTVPWPHPSEDEAVLIDSPSVHAGWRARASVVPGAWFVDSSPWDIAVLRLEHPAPDVFGPAPLHCCGDPDRREVDVCGYPGRGEGAVWSYNRMHDKGGARPGYIQLESRTGSGAAISRGYSGAGVREARTGAVIGLATTSYTDPGSKLGFMLPLELIRDAWPGLRDLLAPATGADGGDGGHGSPIEAVCLELARITALAGASDRARLVRMVNRNLPRPLDAAPAPDMRAHLFDIVEECWQAQGGRYALRRAVSFLFPDSPAHELLNRLSAPTTDRLFSADAEQRVKELLSGLDFPSLRDVFSIAAAKAGADIHAVGFPDAWGAFRLLLDCMADHGVPPYLLFAQMVLDELTEGDAVGAGAAGGPAGAHRVDRLRDWISGQADLLEAAGVTDVMERLEELRSARKPGRDHLPLYLIFQIETEEEGAGDIATAPCALTPWRQTNPVRWEPQPMATESLSVADLARRVPELITQADTGWAHHFDRDLVLEFALSRDLMGLDVDLWPLTIADGMPTVPIGIEYDVVVRGLERQLAPLRKRSRRWRTLAGPGPAGSGRTPPIHWIPERGYRDDRELMARLMRDRDSVAGVLSAPPHHDRGRKELFATLYAGISVLIWDREHRSGPAFRDFLKGMIGASGHDGIFTLKKSIRDLRLEAFSVDSQEDDAPGRDISLFWDDPDRPLQTGVRLSEPA
ncbi:hypothetical protein HDA32_003704 [Spinactinospora alkalitolerans]|uniref:Serine protease n=1 Tax=Spinactinospora alkalitolerans TaxID=687207 RepID=A0A852U375_9ACTN|nr:trypsin-like peptidase domain-containing protein [Spinactinospora alkalitolerans]NYE48584.1 hypothetical protein [Spinactinospora alkalitolerans]